MSDAAKATSARTAVTVGVFGHYGNENLGDEAIIEAVIQSVRQYWQNARIYGFSINPDDTQRRYGVPAYPIRAPAAASPAATAAVASAAAVDAGEGGAGPTRKTLGALKRMAKRVWLARVLYRAAGTLLGLPQTLAREWRFLRESRRRLREVDLLLVSGSNQFLDNFGGVWGFPYTLLKWSLLARLTGTRLAFLSVGAGPLSSPLSRLFVRVALRLADYASFRDQASKRLVEAPGFRSLGAVYPDLAHGIAMPAAASGKDRGHGPAAIVTVGINPMPVYDRRYWYDPDDGRYRDYVDRLAEFATLLRRDGCRVFFFPTQKQDENVIRDVLQALPADVRAAAEADGAVCAGASVAELLKVYATADVVVATRFHGVLLALRAGCPVIGICYFRKTRDLLKDVGQEDYALDLESFTVTDLHARFRALVTHRAAAASGIRARGEAYRQALHEQYRRVFALVEA